MCTRGLNAARCVGGGDGDGDGGRGDHDGGNGGGSVSSCGSGGDRSSGGNMRTGWDTGC